MDKSTGMTTDTTVLHGYAERLLAGTGLTGSEAEVVASGTQRTVPHRAETAAAALRDGWAAAAERAGALS